MHPKYVSSLFLVYKSNIYIIFNLAQNVYIMNVTTITTISNVQQHALSVFTYIPYCYYTSNIYF